MEISHSRRADDQIPRYCTSVCSCQNLRLNSDSEIQIHDYLYYYIDNTRYSSRNKFLISKTHTPYAIDRRCCTYIIRYHTTWHILSAHVRLGRTRTVGRVDRLCIGFVCTRMVRRCCVVQYSTKLPSQFSKLGNENAKALGQATKRCTAKPWVCCTRLLLEYSKE